MRVNNPHHLSQDTPHRASLPLVAAVVIQAAVKVKVMLLDQVQVSLVATNTDIHHL